jgi:CubicO group peptidase (beta-lactamase class C family)
VSGDFAAVDAIVGNFAARGGQPGIAYGIVTGGELVHSGGVGRARLGQAGTDGNAVPDADTVFRIASMSKSFTASSILALRDAGVLALDDPAARYVPQLTSWRGPSADAATVTIRHLLTMTAGFPTDDPWGDRQQGLPIGDFAAMLADGVGFNWAPGTRFEYSNLGYAVLGMVITAASGISYADFVRTRLLAPLGMSRTGYEAAEFAGDAGLAYGYRHALTGWEEVPFDPHGAFAPMGGVFSTVRDLATWVAGFASAFPPGNAAAGSHPLRAASRREMQLPQVITGWSKAYPLPGGGASGGPGAYGFGLFVDEEPDLGRVVSHSGGYPGFGSNMRWHPASGTGVIALGNGTYAPMSSLAAMILDAIVAKRPAAYQIALAPGGGVWPQTLTARDRVAALVAAVAEAVDPSTGDTSAGESLLSSAGLFTENVALDRPYAERARDIALLRERLGGVSDSQGRPAEHDTPAHCRWFLAGSRAVAQAQIQLSPEQPPRVQSLTLAIPPAEGFPLARTLEAVIAWLNSGATSWPESVPVTGGADTGLLARRLRMAAAWTGTVAPGAYRAGDGAASLTVELAGEHAPAILAISVDSATGALRAADVTVLPGGIPANPPRPPDLCSLRPCSRLRRPGPAKVPGRARAGTRDWHHGSLWRNRKDFDRPGLGVE